MNLRSASFLRNYVVDHVPVVLVFVNILTASLALIIFGYGTVELEALCRWTGFHAGVVKLILRQAECRLLALFSLPAGEGSVPRKQASTTAKSN